MDSGSAPHGRSVETLLPAPTPPDQDGRSWPVAPGRQTVRVEALIEASEAQEAPAGPWPICGSSIATFSESAYQRACSAELLPHLGMTICIRRRLFQLEPEAYAAIAFRLITDSPPSRTLWQFHVDALRRGTLQRQDLLDRLIRGEYGPARPIVFFDDGFLRRFVELTGIGLQDVVALLFGLFRRQARRRAGLLLHHVRSLFGGARG